MYWQSETEALKEENCKGYSSWEAERIADAAIIDGLNSKNFISMAKWTKKRMVMIFRLINKLWSFTEIEKGQKSKYHYEHWR